MKKLGIIFSMLFILCGFTYESKEVVIKEAKLKFSLPNDNWSEHHVGHKKDVVYYHYHRKGVIDHKDGHTIVPEVMIVVEPVTGSTDLTYYSITKQKPYQSLKKFKVEKVFTRDDGMLKLDYAVGNKASYVDEKNMKHTFYFIHAIKDRKGIQVILSIPSDFFETYEEELTSVIRSLEYQ